MNDCY